MHYDLMIHELNPLALIPVEISLFFADFSDIRYVCRMLSNKEPLSIENEKCLTTPLIRI